MKRLALAALIAALAPVAQADPNPQLVRSVEMRLAGYGLRADVSQFATPTVARLHLTLSRSGHWVEKRRELIHILRNPVYK